MLRYQVGHVSRFGRILASLCFVGLVGGAAACSSASADDPSLVGNDALQLKPGEEKTPSEKKPAPPSNNGNYLDFVGAWTSDNGPIDEIVFLSTVDGTGHHFFAHAKPGVTSSAKAKRPEGIYHVTRDFLALDAKGAELSGSYRYTFESKDVLLLSDTENPSKAPYAFKRLPSFCDAPADCEGQGIAHVDCVGGFVCQANACNWTCAEPPQEQCGAVTCAVGEVCCNSSCGACVKPGGACTQQICPVDK